MLKQSTSGRVHLASSVCLVYLVAWGQPDRSDDQTDLASL